MKLIGMMLMVAVAFSGCSLTLQKHRDDGTIRSSLVDERCSGSRTLPWWDIGLMSVNGAAALTTSAVHDGAFGGAHNNDGLAIATGVTALAAMLYLASADVGFKRAKACETGVWPTYAAR